MALIFKPPKGWFEENFTHKAWVLGCPCYWNDKTLEITERDLIPEWWLDVNIWVSTKIAEFWFGVVKKWPPEKVPVFILFLTGDQYGNKIV